MTLGKSAWDGMLYRRGQEWAKRKRLDSWGMGTLVRTSVHDCVGKGSDLPQ
jgi:hypothetical protein